MATPKPGEIRCPTCHRSTPPAAYCTQCGSAIPSDARARPRGMDRDELQERIRARRSGGEPYRRGGPADDAGYQRFEPEPEDANVAREQPVDQRRPDYFDDAAAAAAAAAAPAPPPAAADRGDLTRETDDWTTPVPPSAAAAAAADTPAPDSGLPEDERAAPAAAAAAATSPDEEPYESYDYDDAVGYPYEYDSWEDRRERRSGSGAFAIIGFLGLGVLALLAGAVLAGVFSGDEVALESTPPSIEASEAPSVSVAPSVAASVAPSVEASAAPVESGEPVVFPDGFVAIAEPCFPGSAGQDGCNSNGATNGGVVDIWVGFENGNASDVIGAAIIGPDGNTVTEGSIDLADIGCGASCNGWTFFNFRNLEPGAYQVRVTRNGDLASSTGFEVS
jgi:hypothetical protein